MRSRNADVLTLCNKLVVLYRLTDFGFGDLTYKWIERKFTQVFFPKLASYIEPKNRCRPHIISSLTCNNQKSSPSLLESLVVEIIIIANSSKTHLVFSMISRNLHQVLVMSCSCNPWPHEVGLQLHGDGHGGGAGVEEQRGGGGDLKRRILTSCRETSGVSSKFSHTCCLFLNKWKK